MLLSTYAQTSLLRRHDKRSRSHSSDELSIEEISPDDMGYDADVEVIKPDNYEEAESDFEDASTPQEDWTSVDEELAARMTQLGRERLMPFSQSTGRGRKRRSVEIEDDENLLWVPLSPEVEEQQTIDVSNHPSPAKRRRKRSKRPHSAQEAVRSNGEMWTDSSNKAGPKRRVQQDASNSSTPSEQAAATNGEDDDTMDVT